MNFLFVYDNLEVGGIETLLVRMSNWLVESNHKVKLLLGENGPLKELLSDKVNIYINRPFFYEITTHKSYKKLIKSDLFNELDIIYTFRPNTLFLSLQLKKFLKQEKLLVLTGLYHPDEVVRMGGRLRLKQIVYKKIYTKILNEENIFFMNGKCRENHEKIFDKKMSKSNIFPLPIEKKYFTYSNNERKLKKYKIVSIGNLKEFKSYNLYMLPVIRKLLDEGFSVFYDIYGAGPLKARMLKQIDELKLNKKVRVIDQIEYKEIKNVLRDAYAFIGMGTSVIEAAYCGVPAIVAQVYNAEGFTNGYMQNIKGYNCGEIDPDISAQSAFDLLKHLFLLSDIEYKETCDQTRISVKKYEIQTVMSDFVEKVVKLQDGNKSTGTLLTFSNKIIFSSYLMIKFIEYNWSKIIFIIKGILQISYKFFQRYWKATNKLNKNTL